MGPGLALRAIRGWVYCLMPLPWEAGRARCAELSSVSRSASLCPLRRTCAFSRAPCDLCSPAPTQEVFHSRRRLGRRRAAALPVEPLDADAFCAHAYFASATDHARSLAAHFRFAAAASVFTSAAPSLQDARLASRTSRARDGCILKRVCSPSDIFLRAAVFSRL